MNSQQAEHTTSPAPDTEALVADFLRSHPNFFENNPELLASLQIPHPVSGGAISLIERQVRVLRRQLDTERGRLAHLLSRARDYEALSSRMHAFVLQLVAINDPEQLCHSLRDALMREFQAEAVALKLFALDAPSEPEHDELTTAFRDFVDRSHPLCGPLAAEKAKALFGEINVEVLTAALVPVRANGHSGVLAIGSSDPDRFHPDMGTNFLEQLGEVISHKLHAVYFEPCT